MKQLAVISGKGGTGKTVITASFAALARSKVLVDCDVDAANLYILLDPRIEQRESFSGSRTAFIDKGKCTLCGRCEEACRFDAIRDCVVDPISCEGCEVCYHVCPDDAVVLKDITDGEWYVSWTRFGPFVHARLGAGRPNSGKLVTLIKAKAVDLAREKGYERVIIDGPPGTGCPVISTLSNVDVALVVVEPTLSGIHDMERVIQIARHFGVAPAVCVNKYDLNEKMTRDIESYCGKERIPFVGKVSFSREVQQSVSRCVPVVEYSGGDVAGQIRAVWREVDGILEETRDAS